MEANCEDIPTTVTYMAFILTMLHLVVTANVVRSSQNLVTVMMEAIRSSETSVPIRTTRRHIPKEGIPLSKTKICFRVLQEI
jgi:hypothetical protein